jgi:CheY-like chemotaxis protein
VAEELRRKALAVTQQKDLGSRVAAILVREGYECLCVAVEQASSRREVQKALTSSRFDLVLTQQRMISYNALEVLDDTKVAAAGRLLPVACLAYDDNDRNVFHLKDGAAFRVYDSVREPLADAIADLLRQVHGWLTYKLSGRNVVLQAIDRYDLEVRFHEFAIKMFRELRYSDVRHNHGPAEKGKDIIFWEENKLGEREYTGVQIKLGNIDGSTGENGASKIFLQVFDAFSSHMEFVEEGRIPDKYVLMATGEIKKEARAKLKEYLRRYHLRGQIFFLDRQQIADLVIGSCPDLVGTLAQRDHD